MCSGASCTLLGIYLEHFHFKGQCCEILKRSTKWGFRREGNTVGRELCIEENPGGASVEKETLWEGSTVEKRILLLSVVSVEKATL